jgi:hypothetical protein
MTLWITALWIKAVDNGRVINRLWTRLWTKFERGKGEQMFEGRGKAEVRAFERAGLFRDAVGIVGAAPYNPYCMIPI